MTYPWPNKAVPARVIAVVLTSHLCLTTSLADPPFPAFPHPDADARCTSGPQLQGRKLRSGADLSGLDLRGMTLYGTDHRYEDVDLSETNLSGASLEGADFLSTTFSNCSFRNAIMRRAEADWVVDSSCDLTGADISGSRIHLDANQLRSTLNYKNKDLSHTSIRLFKILPGFDFANFDFRGTVFLAQDPTERVLFAGADFTGADVGRATIRLTAEQLQSTKNYKAKDLSDTTIMGDFAGVSFRGFNLRQTTFLLCDLAGCDFTDAEIWGMSIYGGGAYDGDGRWTGNSTCLDSRFTKEQLYSTRSYQRRDLDCVQFHRCDFQDADFSNQTLGFFSECDLEGARFTNADHISGAGNRRYTPCPNTAGVLARHDSPPIGFRACNLAASQFYSTRSFAKKTLQPGCRMERMDLEGWDFSSFDLRYVRFGLSNLQDAKLDNARGGCFETPRLSVSQVKSMWNYQDGELKLEPGFSLHPKLENAFRAENSEGAD